MASTIICNIIYFGCLRNNVMLIDLEKENQTSVCHAL